MKPSIEQESEIIKKSSHDKEDHLKALEITREILNKYQSTFEALAASEREDAKIHGIKND